MAGFTWFPYIGVFWLTLTRRFHFFPRCGPETNLFEKSLFIDGLTWSSAEKCFFLLRLIGRPVLSSKSAQRTDLFDKALFMAGFTWN